MKTLDDAGARALTNRGTVLRVEHNMVVFQPRDTSYELHLEPAGGEYAGPVGTNVAAWIRARARKLWTVGSGGNFLTPIAGPPRIVQGRVRYLDETVAVVQAGAYVIVELPSEAAQIDLNVGALRVGGMVNVAVFPGASVELVPAEGLTLAERSRMIGT